MESISSFDLIFSFIFTWVLGLFPAYLIRFKLHKKPVKKRFAIPLVFLFWIIQQAISATISYYAGVEWKPSSALGLVALVSFFIMRHKSATQKDEAKPTESVHHIEEVKHVHTELPKHANKSSWMTNNWFKLSVLLITFGFVSFFFYWHSFVLQISNKHVRM